MTKLVNIDTYRHKNTSVWNIFWGARIYFGGENALPPSRSADRDCCSNESVPKLWWWSIWTYGNRFIWQKMIFCHISAVLVVTHVTLWLLTLHGYSRYIVVTHVTWLLTLQFSGLYHFNIIRYTSYLLFLHWV